MLKKVDWSKIIVVTIVVVVPFAVCLRELMGGCVPVLLAAALNIYMTDQQQFSPSPPRRTPHREDVMLFY